MVQNLWKSTQVVCASCSGKDIEKMPKMELKAGTRSMFYACPKYYPENRQKGEIACVNHVSTDDFQRILDVLSEEVDKNLMFGQSSYLVGFSFKVKTIDVKVVEQTDEKIVVSVLNHKAVQL